MLEKFTGFLSSEHVCSSIEKYSEQYKKSPDVMIINQKHMADMYGWKYNGFAIRDFIDDSGAKIIQYGDIKIEFDENMPQNEFELCNG